MNPHVARRVVVLNKLFMKHITDLMASGETSVDIIGHGIEITKVQLSNDFMVVRVYWFAPTSTVAELKELTSKLDQCAYQLRHELSQLKVIGVVPPIKFVLDKQSIGALDLEKHFSTADYGENHTPSINLDRQEQQLTLYTKLSEEVRKKILETNDDEEESNKVYLVNLPPMRHDVLGLPHLAIMTKVSILLPLIINTLFNVTLIITLFKVQQAVNKTRETAMNRLKNIPIEERSRAIFDASKISILRNQEDTDAFNDFLLKRQIEEKRKNKLQSFQDNLDLRELEPEDNEDNDNPQDYDDFDPKQWQ